MIAFLEIWKKFAKKPEHIGIADFAVCIYIKSVNEALLQTFDIMQSLCIECIRGVYLFMANQHAKDKKQIGFWLNEATLQEFSEKCKNDEIDKTELLQSAINAYLYGYSVYKCKSGKVVVSKIQINE